MVRRTRCGRDGRHVHRERENDFARDELVAWSWLKSDSLLYCTRGGKLQDREKKNKCQHWVIERSRVMRWGFDG